MPKNHASVLELPNNNTSDSSDAPASETANPVPFYTEVGSNQSTIKCEAIQIVDVYSVQSVPTTSAVLDSSVASSNHTTPANTSVGSWHSPTSSNSESSDNFQTPPTQAARNWHTPSLTLPESLVSKDKTPSASNTREARLDPSQTAGSTRNTSQPSTSSQNSVREDEEDIFIVEVVKANKGSIARHWEKYSEGYRCKECKKTYKKLNKCENHIRIHLGIRPFECKVCRRRFLKKRLLNEHNFSHTGAKLYQCKECPKAFRYRKNFKLHLEIHTEVVSRSYLCEVCLKTFTSQYDYWNHKSSKHIISVPRPTAVR